MCTCVCFLSLSLFLFSLRSGGSNVYYFCYTWPCLFGRTYQRRLVGASLPLPAYLPVWSGPVWSNACRHPCAICFFSSLFLSFLYLSWPAWMDCTSPLLFHQYFTPLPLSVRPSLHHRHLSWWLTFGAPRHSPESPQTVPCLCTFISVWGTDRRVGKVERGEMHWVFVRERKRMNKDGLKEENGVN